MPLDVSRLAGGDIRGSTSARRETQYLHRKGRCLSQGKTRRVMVMDGDDDGPFPMEAVVMKMMMMVMMMVLVVLLVLWLLVLLMR